MYIDTYNFITTYLPEIEEMIHRIFPFYFNDYLPGVIDCPHFQSTDYSPQKFIIHVLSSPSQLRYSTSHRFHSVFGVELNSGMGSAIALLPDQDLSEYSLIRDGDKVIGIYKDYNFWILFDAVHIQHEHELNVLRTLLEIIKEIVTGVVEFKVDDVEGIIKSLVSSLQSVHNNTVNILKRNIASAEQRARELTNDLINYEKELVPYEEQLNYFNKIDNWEITYVSNTLVIFSNKNDVILKGINLGKYDVAIYKNGDELTVHSKKWTDYPHPHISRSGQCCWGNLHGNYITATETCDFPRILSCVWELLHEYNPADKFVSLRTFGKPDDLDDESICYECEAELEVVGGYGCSSCFEIFCEYHFTSCEICEEGVCERCSKWDDICEQTICGVCMVDHERDCHFTCDSCSFVYHIDDGSYIESEDISVCSSCLEKYYTWCDDCELYVRNGHLHEEEES